MEFIAEFFFTMTKWPVIPFLITAVFLIPLLFRASASYVRPKSRFWLIVAAVIWGMFSLFNLFPRSNEMAYMLLKVWVLFPILLVLTVNAFMFMLLGAGKSKSGV